MLKRGRMSLVCFVIALNLAFEAPPEWTRARSAGQKFLKKECLFFFRQFVRGSVFLRLRFSGARWVKVGLAFEGFKDLFGFVCTDKFDCNGTLRAVDTYSEYGNPNSPPGYNQGNDDYDQPCE